MFDLAGSWVWDFWFADDGERYHLFFLYASRALQNPDARHERASIGHAVSADMVHWTQVADALVRSDTPAFDDLATWTGSVVQHPDGTWFMFYTGATLDTNDKNVQRIGYATSPDLDVWTKSSDAVLEAFRDPWVFPDPGGDGWQVTQVEVIDGRPVLLFSCGAEHATEFRRQVDGGVWAVNAESVLGPFAVDEAYPVTTENLYVGRLLQHREDGAWFLFAFLNIGSGGGFVGGITDPMPVRWHGERLVADLPT